MPNFLSIENKFKIVEDSKKKQAKEITYTINENGCFINDSHAKDKDGYPRIQRGKGKIRGNRYVYELFHGSIPEGMVVMHICDNPSCINPEHLEVGTHKENMADRQRKGRTLRGERNGKSKISDKQAYYIKFESTESYKELALKFGVSVDYIKNIRLGKNRKWLTRDSEFKSAA